MIKIEKLTKEQEEYLPVFREEVLSSALGGKRINRDNLQTAINDAYAEIEKEPPLLIILQSPLQAMMAIKFMEMFAKEELGGQLGYQLRGQLRGKLGGQLGDQLGDQLGGQLGDQLRGQLWGKLRGQLGDQLGDQLRDQLGDQLRGQLWGKLRGQLGDQLRGQLWGKLRGQLWDQLVDQLGGQQIYNSNYLWGSQDLYWIAWAKFGEYIGVKYTTEQSRGLDIMYRIGQQCEWWWPYENICFVSEKPLETKWDDGVLHNEQGPAVLYEDGYAVYSWRGTNIPKEWIEEKENLTPETALKWENVEQRRCAAEILGWHNVLEHPSLKPKTVDEDNDPQIGKLISVDLPDIGRENFLFVECGTKRKFALPVPPDMKTALDAQAWLNFCTAEEILELEIRT